MRRLSVKTTLRTIASTVGAAAALSLVFVGGAQAHCDSMDGPVITEARAALETGDVTPLLKWVPAEDEAEIRRVFADVRKVRKGSEIAREIADHHLFATLVKVHRASEGAPFTGIKPAGRIDPGLMAADAALENGRIDRLVANVTRKVEEGIRNRYETARRARGRADQSVHNGREYVADYVNYIHYVEGVHGAAGAGGHGH
jgi:hypothetical protein